MSRRQIALAVLLLVCCLGSPAASGEKMYWVDGLFDEIRRANLDGSDVEVLVAGLLWPKGIALDVRAGIMYWTDAVAEKIQRANLQIPEGETPDTRTDIEDLVSGVVAHSIALDVGGGKMYWTTSDPSKVQRANLDGSGVEDLVTTGVSYPRSIALDLKGGKIYLAGSLKIQRANLDGSNVEDLVDTSGNGTPYSLALDVEGGKMYWMSAGISFGLFPMIRRANLDGSGVEVVLDPAQLGEGIAVDPGVGKVYWTTIVGGKIIRVNLDGSGVETVLDNESSDLKAIALDLTPTIPAASQWGLIALIALLLATGGVIIRRRGPRQNHCEHSGRFGGQTL